jgi:AcrR family transcriptional regulator
MIETEEYRNISIDGIAAMAKVGKQSIYRWWPSKADLVLDAYTSRTLTRLPPYIPSGDVFADLGDDLDRYYTLIRQSMVSKGVRSLIAEAQLDDAFRKKLYDQVWKLRCERVHQILRHGQQLGQVRTDIALPNVAHLIHGSAWYRLLSGTTMPLDTAFAHDVIALLRPGIAASRG